MPIVSERERVSVRKQPNIHICGNPATGKTTLAKKLATKFEGLSYVDLGKEGMSRGCIEGRDDKLDCDILDYEKLADLMVPDLEKGGKVLDWIHSDLWEPPSLIDLVVVLTCNNTVLFDRYVDRDYNERKIEQNTDSEIMQEIVSETREYYEPEDADEEEQSTKIMVLKSDTDTDMEHNLKSIFDWIEDHKPS